MKKKKFSPVKMVQDLAVDKYTPDMYYDALNVRINASNSNTFGGISNDLGNALEVKLPNIYVYSRPERIILTHDTVGTGTFPTNILQIIPYTSREILATGYSNNHQIIGSAKYNEFIILFSTSAYNYNASNDGAIWRYEPATATLELLYYNQLGFSLEFPIRKAIVSYETADIIRLYFTDFKNYYRMLDIAKPGVINTPLTNLTVLPSASLPSVETTGIVETGLFKNGKVGYMYQLYSENGTITAPSVMSELLNVNRKYRGGTFEELAGIGFKLQVSVPDTRFDYIRLYRVFYSSKDTLPQVGLLADRRLDHSQNFKFTDIGNEVLELLTISELYESYYYNFVAKTAIVKDGHMFPGNIRSKGYYPDWDARAYRFAFRAAGDPLTSADLKAADNSSLSFTISDLQANPDLVPKDHDCINRSNYAETRRNATQTNGYYTGSETPNYKKYYYRGNGTTLGGEGLNVKYRFVTQNYDPVLFNNSLLQGFSLTDRSYAFPGNSKIAGYKRDEVYRFGIRLTNTEGLKSPVYWIGDIRFPTADMAGYHLTEEINGTVVFRVLGVRFEVNNLPADCQSWEIVRVERTQADKTIISQGYLQPTVYQREASSQPSNPADMYKYRVQPSIYLKSAHTNFVGQAGIYDWGRSLSHLEPIYTLNSTDNLLQNTNILQFYSPEIEFFNTNFGDNRDAYLKIIGGAYKINASLDASTRRWRDGTTLLEEALDGYKENYFQLYADQGHVENIAFTHLFKGIQTELSSVIRYADSRFIPESYNGNENDLPNIYILDDNVIDTGNAIADKCQVYHNHGTGLGYWRADVAHNLTLRITPQNHVLTNVPGLEDHLGGTFTVDSRYKIPVVDLKRNLEGSQYLGYTYEARSFNTYINCSSTVFKSAGSTVVVLAGDTYLTYFSHTRLSGRQLSSTTAFFGSIKEDVIVPIESTLNLDVRSDNYKTMYANMDVHVGHNFEYNDVYSQENNAFQHKPLPFFFKEDVDQFYRILGSNPKVYGDRVDNWMRYKADAYLDVGSENGHINELVVAKNEVLCFQDTAISHVRVFPREMVQNQTGQNLQLGFGSMLQDYIYITTTNGTRLQFAVIPTMQGVYFVDDNAKKVFFMSMGDGFGPISDVGMMGSYLRNRLNWNNIKHDNPYMSKGLVMGYSEQYGDLMLSIMDKGLERADSFTLTYNKDLNGYTTFNSFVSPLHIAHQGEYYLIQGNKLWKHYVPNYCSYFGEIKPMRITLIVYPEERHYSSIYEVLGFTSKVINAAGQDFALEGITRIRAFNEYQDSGWVNAQYLLNSKRIFREWKVSVPRENRNKMRGTYTFIELEYTGDGTKQITINDFIMSYQLFPGAY